MSAGTLLPKIKVSANPLTRSNRAYMRFEDAWTFPPYSHSNILVNASICSFDYILRVERNEIFEW